MNRAAATASTGLVLVGVLVLAAGCGGADPPANGSAGPSGSASGSARAGTTASPTATGSRPADPLAGPSVPAVVRGGRTPSARMSAAPAGLTPSGGGTVRYADDVRLEITGVRQGQVTGEGPGVIRGPRTTFEMRLTNDSSSPVDLDQVVVTLVYGRPGRIAQPVYGQGVRDFSSRLGPGRAASAAYAFSIPEQGRSAVSVHVDFDAVHAAAVFSGPVA